MATHIILDKRHRKDLEDKKYLIPILSIYYRYQDRYFSWNNGNSSFFLDDTPETRELIKFLETACLDVRIKDIG